MNLLNIVSCYTARLEDYNRPVAEQNGCAMSKLHARQQRSPRTGIRHYLPVYRLTQRHYHGLADVIPWINQHAFLLSIVGMVSLLLLLVSVVGAPWAIARLPSDYLLKPRTHRPGPRYLIVAFIRSLLGFALIATGLVMLVTPGPGLVLLIVGISVSEFPGKHHLLLYVATQPRVFQSLNWMRNRHGKPPFDHPGATLQR